MPSPSQTARRGNSTFGAVLRVPLWLAYQAAYLLLTVVAAPFLWMRKGGPKRQGLRHYLETLPGRLTVDLPAAPALPGGGKTVWLHAVSVGEAMVATTLANALARRLPNVRMVVTTVTPTGQRQARSGLRRWIEEGRVAVAYLPFDLSPLLGRFHRRFRPAALVLIEGDYWPLALADAKRRGLPVAVVNGRVSDRAFRRQRPLGRINDLFYRHVDLFGVQTEDDARRFAALGVDPNRVHITGNLKFDAPPPPAQPQLEQALRTLADGRPVLVAGSTMAGPRSGGSAATGEEAMVLDAFAQVREVHEALLVLAPRHPERFGAVAELLAGRGLPFVRRSGGAAGDGVEGARPVVLLLDTLGELARVYSLATSAFIGGTLVATGGHNPLEPAQFGVPTAVGPSMDNFREMARIFDQAQAWSRVADAAALAHRWTAWLDDPAAATEVGRRARRLLEDGAGAVERSLELLSPVLHAPATEGQR